MAYIARLRCVHGAVPSAGALVPARGDKWYIDPEEMRQYEPPNYIRFGGGWPMSWGPNWAHDVFMNKNSMYPRMPFYQRQLKNPNLKYDYGIGMRKNFGETFHIMEEWLSPQGQEWSRDNGCQNLPGGILDWIFMLTGFYFFIQLVDWCDKQYALSMYAPKIYPFDNLWVEQGGNPLVPQERRPYIFSHIPVLAPDFGMQKC